MRKRAQAIGGTIISRPAGKYHALKTVYNGHTYDSAGEAEYAWLLDQKVKLRQVDCWSRPSAFVLLDAPRRSDRITYKPDFYVVERGQDHGYYVDFKSNATETYSFRMKVRLWKQKIPHELRIAYKDGTHKVVATGEIAV